MARIFFILLVVSGCTARAGHITINIQKAIREKKVKASVISLGGHQGYCLQLSVKNLTQDSLVLLIEAGLRFNSESHEEQDILLVKSETLVLRRGQTRATALKGYCCQASNRSPSANSKYGVGKLADSALCALAQCFDTSMSDQDIEQQAIWAISDRKETSTIPPGSDSCAMELRKLVAKLKGEPVPWYTVGIRSHVYSNGRITQFATYVSGTLNFTVATDCYGTFSVEDSTGQKVQYIKSEWLTHSENQDYHFKVPVAGLKKGSYYVTMRGEGRTLARKKFEM